MKFSIIISALGKNLYKISDWISKEIVNEVDEIIVIIQASKGFIREVNLLREIGINCLISDAIGLSKSRNHGINSSRSDFIWFLDDDIKTDINKIKIVKSNIINNKADIYTFRIALDFIKRVEQVETNIIIFELENKADESKFLKTLADKNIRLSGMGNGKLRIVTHLDYTNEMHEYFLNELKGLKF